LPSYSCLPNVRPKWLSKFLGHKWQTVTVSAILLVLAVVTVDWADLFIGCGALIGLFMSPDLDLSWSRMGVLGRIGLADEYTKLFKHRKLSHVPVLGTLTRVPVVGIFIAIFFLVSGLEFPLWIFWRLFWGLVVSDAWHTLLDQLSSHVFSHTRTTRSRR